MKRVMVLLVFVSALPSSVLAQDAGAITGDPTAGQRDFAICMACHQIGPNAKIAVGPVLNGVVGRKVASYPGFDYSDALKNSGIKEWTVPELEKWLAGPMKLVPGTKMIFPGFTDPKQVNDVIAYLAQYNDKGEKK